MQPTPLFRRDCVPEGANAKRLANGRAEEGPAAMQLTGLAANCHLVHSQSLGEDMAIRTPFGRRKLLYVDYTASGRSLRFVENYLQEIVAPLYANTHTTTTTTGRQTTAFREEARSVVHRLVGASKDEEVIFAGAGATGAIHRFAGMLEIPRLVLKARTEGTPLPYALIGALNHHSNILAWVEAGMRHEMLEIDPDTGGISLSQLEASLRREKAAGRPLIVVAVTAASNLTGIPNPLAQIAALAHTYGAVVCADYAAAAPHLRIDMKRPEDTDINKLYAEKHGQYTPCSAEGVSVSIEGEAAAAGAAASKEADAEDTAAAADDAVVASTDTSLDACVFSPHKFPGGPGTPGVLVVKRSLCQNRVPVVPGGGTVAFVSRSGFGDYLPMGKPDREEGGTPEIMGAIRTGLVMQMFNSLGGDSVYQVERATTRAALRRLRAHPNISVLGQEVADDRRIAIISFRIFVGPQNARPDLSAGCGIQIPGSPGRAGNRLCSARQVDPSTGKTPDTPTIRLALHHDLVSALLNDLFGIQARSGCMCAGPYAERLLGVDDAALEGIRRVILSHEVEIMKLGFSRISLPFHIPKAETEFVMRAIEWIADNGYRFTGLYTPDPNATGAADLRNAWSHHSFHATEAAGAAAHQRLAVPLVRLSDLHTADGAVTLRTPAGEPGAPIVLSDHLRARIEANVNGPTQTPRRCCQAQPDHIDFTKEYEEECFAAAEAAARRADEDCGAAEAGGPQHDDRGRSLEQIQLDLFDCHSVGCQQSRKAIREACLRARWFWLPGDAI